MYDIHSHIIYGVDDGSPDKESSRALLAMAAATGTSHIVATPHVIEMYDHPTWAFIQEGVEELRAMAKADNLELEIMPGAEVMLSLDILQAYDEAPHAFCLNNTNYALVELPMFEVPKYTEDLFYEMQLRGLIPVLAHPERYAALMQTPERLLEWCHKGVLLQCNGGSLLGKFGQNAERNLRFLLHNKLISFMGSDAHRITRRNTDLQAERQKLIELVGKAYADAICIENPRTILAGEVLKISILKRLSSLPQDKKSFWKKMFE